MESAANGSKLRLIRERHPQLQFVRTLERDFPYLAALARQGEAELLLAQADKAGEGA